MVRYRWTILPAGLLLILAVPRASHADAHRDVAGVRFEAGLGDRAPAGVTFSAGPAAVGSVTFTPGARLTAPGDTPPITRTEAPAPTAAPERVVAPAAEPAAIPVPSAMDHPSSEPVHSARAHATPTMVTPPDDRVTPVEAMPARCSLVGAIRHVDLDVRGLRATQLSLATRDDRVVALISMARNAPLRALHDGLVFPESRLVIDTGHDVSTLRSLGVEPDAAIALAQDGRVFVASYEHLDGSARVPGGSPSVRIAVLDADGHVSVAPHTIDATAGLRIDSSVVPFGAGVAVVLGRESVLEDGSHGPVRESLYLFDEAGAVARDPVVITDAQGDETLSRHRVGLAVTEAGTALRTTWSVPSGHDVGVWSARFDGSQLGAPARVVDRAAWGTEVSGDGAGVLFRSGGEQGLPVGLFYRGFEAGSRELALGAGWDPDVAMVNGNWLVAGVALQGADGRPVDALVAVARPGEPLRAVATPDVADAVLGDAVDVEMASTSDGVAVAWIDPGSSEPGGPTRRLGLARVVCR